MSGSKVPLLFSQQTTVQYLLLLDIFSFFFVFFVRFQANFKISSIERMNKETKQVNSLTVSVTVSDSVCV